VWQNSETDYTNITACRHWQPADCWVQFDIDFVMKCWIIKYLSIYLQMLHCISNITINETFKKVWQNSKTEHTMYMLSYWHHHHRSSLRQWSSQVVQPLELTRLQCDRRATAVYDSGGSRAPVASQSGRKRATAAETKRKRSWFSAEI